MNVLLNSPPRLGSRYDIRNFRNYGRSLHLSLVLQKGDGHWGLNTSTKGAEGHACPTVMHGPFVAIRAPARLCCLRLPPEQVAQATARHRRLHLCLLDQHPRERHHLARPCCRPPESRRATDPITLATRLARVQNKEQREKLRQPPCEATDRARTNSKPSRALTSGAGAPTQCSLLVHKDLLIQASDLSAQDAFMNLHESQAIFRVSNNLILCNRPREALGNET